MDMRTCVKYFDDDDITDLVNRFPTTAYHLQRLASYEIDYIRFGKMNELLEYVDGNGFNITYDPIRRRYTIKRGKVK